MGFVNWFSKHFSRVIVPVVFGLCFVYFLYHMLQGDRGVFGWVELSKNCELQERHLQALLQEKEHLETKINLMSEKIDLDLLEYQVRLLLGYHGENEVLVLTSADPQGTF